MINTSLGTATTLDYSDITIIYSPATFRALTDQWFPLALRYLPTFEPLLR